MVAPTGVENRIDNSIPMPEDTAPRTTENIVTFLNESNNLMDVRAGNIITADVKRAPTNFIETTTTIEIITDKMKLDNLTFTPVAFAKLSSNVMLNTLL